MKKLVWGVVWLSLASAARGAGESEWSDSGLRGPKYSEILKLEDSLQHEFKDITRIVDYGTTPKKNPLRMMLVMRKRPGGRRRPTLLMTGSIHGNEYLNLEDRIPGELLKKSRAAGPVREFLDAGGALIFVPIANPDGYEAHRRDNSHGIDLNRDWDLRIANYKGFKESESQALASAIETLRVSENLDYKITVDYHCCAGALLHPWAYKNDSIPEADLARHRAIGQFAAERLKISVGATGQILGYYPVGTTKDYYYTTYGALAFTYEGRMNEENRFLAGHLSWWEDMVRSVNAQISRPFIRLAVEAANDFQTLFRLAE